MVLPGETEAGSAGMQPCRGITWWAHRDDDRARDFQLALTPNFIGSKDPHALKIPARKGGKHSLAENAPSPVQAEPRQMGYGTSERSVEIITVDFCSKTK